MGEGGVCVEGWRERSPEAMLRTPHVRAVVRAHCAAILLAKPPPIHHPRSASNNPVKLRPMAERMEPPPLQNFSQYGRMSSSCVHAERRCLWSAQ